MTATTMTIIVIIKSAITQNIGALAALRRSCALHIFAISESLSKLQTGSVGSTSNYLQQCGISGRTCSIYLKAVETLRPLIEVARHT